MRYLGGSVRPSLVSNVGTNTLGNRRVNTPDSSRVQKKVFRAITFSGIFASSSPLFCSLQMLKLPDVHKLKLLCFVFECRNCLSLKPFDDYFIPLFSIHDHNTCQSFRGDLFVPRIDTIQFGKRTAKYAGSDLWNDLPYDLRNSPSVVFEKQVMKHYLFLYLE